MSFRAFDKLNNEIQNCILRLDLKNCSLAVTRPWLCEKIRREDLILVKISLFSRALTLFDISLVAEK